MSCDTRSIVAWLADGARSAATPQQVFAQLCHRLVRCGVPLWSATLFVPTPHPEISGRRLRWRFGSQATIEEVPFEQIERFDRPFPGIACAEGIRDVLASPLRFTDGSVQIVTWTTRRARGFTADHRAAIERIIAPATRVAEIRALARTTRNLVEAYVGTRSAQRILSGQIRRGDSEPIHAAILLSDMRGFTALADRVPPRTLVALLNRYFDAQVPAILERGGEVLKFMGDGLLAIFPLDKRRRSPAVACRDALSAACEMRSRIADLRIPTEIVGAGGLRLAVALHVGEMLYGNIGGGGRLDFTCIGPAINLAARLEQIASAEGLPIVASGDFAAHCEHSFMPLGAFALPGLPRKQQLYGLPNEARAPSVGDATSCYPSLGNS